MADHNSPHMANPPAPAWQQNADGSPNTQIGGSSVSSTHSSADVPRKQTRPDSGGLQAVIRKALTNTRSGTVQLAFATAEDPIFDLPEYALARVAEGQIVFAWDCSIDDVHRVLKLVDPQNWEPGEEPEMWYVSRPEMVEEAL